MVRYGMAIDAQHCLGCQTCVVACQLHNGLRPNIAWMTVEAIEWGRWPDADRLYFPHLCLHCDAPYCVKVCPTGASYISDGGIVAIDYEKCIGCGVCISACPYGARRINTQDTWFFDARVPAPYETGEKNRINVAEKCTFCAGRVQKGLNPICVDSCPADIRIFGDLDNPGSKINSFIEESAAVCVPGTAVYYAQGNRDFNLASTITSSYYAPLTSVRDDAAMRVSEGNPVVVGVSGIGVAAVAVSLACVAKRRMGKQRANEPGTDK
ncbi:MAG: 4Fe-4S dicluster domain-containing protein [Raoultibacter sp.]